SHETPVVRWFERDRLPATLLPWYRGPLTDAFAAGAPIERHERLGLQSIARAMWIDLRMRATDDRAGL
ncbi:MAG: hypothetical protein MJE66_24995, partial [Proteobacteria bacterium]|nr:hypothetical protein [Pseudomonadota bacterium]